MIMWIKINVKRRRNVTSMKCEELLTAFINKVRSQENFKVFKDNIRMVRDHTADTDFVSDYFFFVYLIVTTNFTIVANGISGTN